MRRVYQIPGLAFLAFSVYLVFESRQMEYYADLGPGPGFFPFWLGVLLAVLSVVWLVQVSVAPARPVDVGVFPDRWGTLRVVAILATLVLFGWAVDELGFQLTMLLFLAFLLTVLGRQNPTVTAAVALGGSFGVYYVFTRWLDVRLPAASIEFLRSWGL
jgi:putative tricarboxylic transport membrane protein